MSSKVTKETIALLACPICSDRPGLELKDDQTLVCSKCSQNYEIAEKGISKLVKEELNKE